MEHNNKTNKNKNIKKPKLKKHKVLKIILTSVVCGVSIFFAVNYFKSKKINDGLPVKDPFTFDNTLDPNGNDIPHNNDGQIELDSISDKDKKILLTQIHSLLLQDANSLLNSQFEKISNIKEILSIYLLPYNQSGIDDEFDKYYLSILFSDNNQTKYTLNYSTGQDFSSNAELSKDFFANFINFLTYNCPLDNCQPMSNEGNMLSSISNALFVGDAYIGYKNSGEECYSIPFYNEDGTTRVYSTLKESLDNYEEDPMSKLLEEMTSDNPENIFEETFVPSSKNLNKVLDIYKEIQSIDSQDKEQNDIENTNCLIK